MSCICHTHIYIIYIYIIYIYTHVIPMSWSLASTFLWNSNLFQRSVSDLPPMGRARSAGQVQKWRIHPLVIYYSYGKWPYITSPLKMMILQCYVQLPEGTKCPSNDWGNDDSRIAWGGSRRFSGTGHLRAPASSNRDDLWSPGKPRERKSLGITISMRGKCGNNLKQLQPWQARLDFELTQSGWPANNTSHENVLFICVQHICQQYVDFVTEYKWNT